MSTTAQTIITGAFDLIGVFQPGETIPSADSTDALRRLNNLLGSWQLQPQTQTFDDRDVFPIVAGKGSTSNPYTIGPTGDLVTTRPTEITGAGLLLGNTSPAVEIPRAVLTGDMWEAIPIKDLTSSLFTSLYYVPTYVSGLGSIYLWPVPDNALHSLVIYRNVWLGSFTSLTASYDLPPGYDEALEYNLAIRLATPYGKPVAPEVAAIAVQSLTILKRSNLRMSDLETDPAFTSGGVYNIVTGQGG